MSGETIFSFDTYSFANGAKEIEAFRHIEELQEDNSWHIIENDVEIEVYTDDEYYAMREEREQEQSHNHTLPYTCFYDMTPCTLEEMVNYLNAYATAMSDGQSVPVGCSVISIYNFIYAYRTLRNHICIVCTVKAPNIHKAFI